MNFQAVVLEPQRKQQKKLRDALNTVYGDLDGAGLSTVEVKILIVCVAV